MKRRTKKRANWSALGRAFKAVERGWDDMRAFIARCESAGPAKTAKERERRRSEFSKIQARIGERYYNLADPMTRDLVKGIARRAQRPL